MLATETPSRDRGKHAIRPKPGPVETPLVWPDVLRAVQGDETRPALLGRYRAAGYGPDDFGRLRGAREAMADALTRTEDSLEGRHGRNVETERDRIRAVRRRLEVELWA